MEWWEALVLGLTQGASEFLPVSSSGHLLLLEKLGVGEENLLFNVLLHAATLLAVIIVFRKDLWAIIRRPMQKKTLYIALACMPTVLIAFVFKFCFPGLLAGDYLATGFMLTACLLIASEKLVFAKPCVNNCKMSILTGVLQGIAVLPGISRSGSTISAMRLTGASKEEAANFSFLLSVPIILGSVVEEIVSSAMDGSLFSAGSFVSITTAGTAVTGASAIGVFPLIVGMVAAFISGLLAIKFFLKLIKNKSLLGFAFYDIAISAVALFAI